VRRLLAALFLIGVIGTAADLFLIGHVEGPWQIVPLVLLVLAAVAGGIMLVTGGGRRVLLLSSWLLIAGGAAGLTLHYRGNMEIEREVSPSLTGTALIWKALRGGSPPSLAPGTLVHLGLIGLVCTFKGAKA
jgi:hypothetical protein